MMRLVIVMFVVFMVFVIPIVIAPGMIAMAGIMCVVIVAMFWLFFAGFCLARPVSAFVRFSGRLDVMRMGVVLAAVIGMRGMMVGFFLH